MKNPPSESAPSSEKPPEAAPSSPTRIITDEKVTKPTTSNRPSPRRIRQYMRSANNNSSSATGAAGGVSNSSLSEQQPPQDTAIDDANIDEAPSRASWMALAATDSDSETNTVDSVTANEIFEDVAVTMQPKPLEVVVQGPVPWDEGHDPSISETPRPIQNILFEKERVERELVEVQVDRDLLRQQLSEARAELEVARSSLRENVSDLEHQLRNLQQSERRQAELEENALLEEEIDELARLAREQEEKSNKDTMGGDEVAISTEGATGIPLDNVSEGGDERNSSKLLSQERELHKNRVTELENELLERKLCERILEKEVCKLKDQAQVESEKLEEAQRQVRWFQQELKAMFPQEGESSSILPIDGKNEDVENQNNAVHLETIMERSTDDEEGEHISGETTNGVGDGNSDSTKEENRTDIRLDKSLSSDSFDHVKLLHDQRLELEHRVQELLEEIGTLRVGERTIQHEKQQSDIQVLQLQTDLQEKQEQHRLELVLVERQLAEWKGRADSFQRNLTDERILSEQHITQSQLERQERQELSQRVEELELEKNELMDSLEKTRVSFEHEKGYLRRAMEALENRVQDTSVDSFSDTLTSNNGDTVPLDEDDSRQSQETLPKLQISDHAFSGDEEGWKKMLDRIQDLEAERKVRIESERALQEQMKKMAEQEKETQSRAAAAEDRVQVLQTFLDASFSASPKEGRQLELEQEYLSVHSRNRDMDEGIQEEFDESTPDSIKNSAIATNLGRTKSIDDDEVKNKSLKAQDEIFYDAQQKNSGLSLYLSQKHSQKSPTQTLKLPDIDELSINSDALVHNLHLKLEEEMGNLKKRKERRRSRAVSADAPSNQGVGKYRPLLNSTSGLLNPNTGKAVADTTIPQPEAVATTKVIVPKDFEHEKTSHEQDCGNDRSKEIELPEKETSTTENEFRIQIEEENSRLQSAIESINYNKAQLEIQLEDAMQQINDSANQISTLTAEITECRCSLEQSENGRSELTKQIAIMRKETETLENRISENEEEKKSYTATLSKLKEDLAMKDKMILENNESHQVELEGVKKALNESLRAREEDHADADRINKLENQILAMETESKSKIEVLSSELESVLEERKALELKCHDASKEHDEFKKVESSLRKALEESMVKLESAQVEIENLSQAKKHEGIEFGKIVSEKNQRIAELEKDLASKGKRLEQASIQLSELENELFERDEEIEKLDAKRHQIQDSASQQLVDMEKVLEEDGKEIDWLKEEKLKIQSLVQEYEHQIEKQQGRLAEASLQLSELESELFAKDDEIEEMELRINAMQALETQRLETLQESESHKKRLEEQLGSAKETIQNLTSQVEGIKQEREAEKTEAHRILIEDEKKNKEILSRETQLNRQLQNVSKLTEQNDKWQLQLEKAHDEKKELLDGLSDVKIEVSSLRKELEESDQKINELNAINAQLKEDLICATEEGEKSRLRISQMEDQKEALSQKLECAVDSLADMQKNNIQKQGSQVVI